METMMIVLAGVALLGLVGYVLYRRSAAVRADIAALKADVDNLFSLHATLTSAVASQGAAVKALSPAPAGAPVAPTAPAPKV